MFRSLIVLALATPAFAEDVPGPNTLTTKEITDGWILLFDGETTFGWKTAGTTKADEGMIKLGKEKKTLAYPTTTFRHFQLEFEWDGQGSMFYHDVETVLRRKTEKKLGESWDRCTIKITRSEKSFGTTSRLATGNLQQEKPTGELDLPIVFGSDPDKELRIRSVKLRPLETISLFTGKDLAGWSVNKADPKRMASKWEVTSEGELSLKNGPGDLVSDKEFDNFVLQLECKPLGKGLNSGVFFRCVPGQYQNGYEAQIQNSFRNDDRTKPVDFGTGAIYRRVPARKVVSNDNEWLTMTVVADGKHVATWVNGYQTVDWMDDRPADENPRKGYRAAKGPLSLQGHDPTTNFLFRKIRIADLPAK